MKKVLLLLAEGFEIYEASAFIDVIGWNLIEGDKSTQLYTCALRKEIKSTFDQKLVVDFIIDEINVDDYEILAIPGGFAEYHFYDDAYSEEFLSLIRAFNAKNKPIVSICTGALPIGKSGILSGKKGTTYNQTPMRHEILKSYGVNVLNEAIVEDSNIITSWNPATAITVAFKLLEKLTSKENTDKIRKLMGY